MENKSNTNTTRKQILESSPLFGSWKNRFKGKNSLEIQKILRRRLFLGEGYDNE